MIKLNRITFIIAICFFIVLKSYSQNTEVCIAVSSFPTIAAFNYDFNSNTWTPNNLAPNGLFPNSVAFDYNNNSIILSTLNTLSSYEIDTYNQIAAPCVIPGISSSLYGYIPEPNIYALTAHPNENILYAIHQVPSNENDVLFQIDMATCSVVANAFGPGEDYMELPSVYSNCFNTDVGKIAGLDYNPVTNEIIAMYGFGFVSILATFDPSTGIATNVIKEFCDFAFDSFTCISNGNYMITADIQPDDMAHSFIYDPVNDVSDSLVLMDNIIYDFEAVQCYNLQTDCNNVLSTDEIIACDSLRWIDGITYSESNTSATFTYEGGAANGCDSIISLNLTINDNEGIITIVQDDELTTTNTTGTFQWLQCDNNFNAIPNATDATFTATASGLYAVEITENGCVDTSTCGQVIITGLDYILQSNEIEIFPNPSAGPISVLTNQQLPIESINVINIEGKIIETIESTQSFDRINLEYAPGIYFLQFNLPQGHLYKSILLK